MTARRLADFVESTAAGEQLLLQRLRDAEHAATSGDFPGVECYLEVPISTTVTGDVAGDVLYPVQSFPHD